MPETTRETQQHPVNKAFGLVPGFINGLIQAIIVAALLLTMPFRSSASDNARESRLAAAFAPPAFWLERELAPVFSEPLRHSLPEPTIRDDLETTMLQLVNEERAKEGLKPLKTDQQMQAVARAHSKDMFAKGYFAHINKTGKDPFDRMHAAGVTYVTAGENLALAQSLPQAHDGLMKSPGHRASILQQRFGRVGIGVLSGGIYGLMITQEFRN